MKIYLLILFLILTSACGVESNLAGDGDILLENSTATGGSFLTPSSDEGQSIPVTIAKAIIPTIDEDYVSAEFDQASDEDSVEITCDECVDLNDTDNTDLNALVTNTETGETLAVDIDENGSFTLKIVGTLDEKIEMHIENNDGDKSENSVVLTMLNPKLFQIDTVKFVNRPILNTPFNTPQPTGQFQNNSVH